MCLSGTGTRVGTKNPIVQEGNAFPGQRERNANGSPRENYRRSEVDVLPTRYANVYNAAVENGYSIDAMNDKSLFKRADCIANKLTIFSRKQSFITNGFLYKGHNVIYILGSRNSRLLALLVEPQVGPESGAVHFRTA